MNHNRIPTSFHEGPNVYMVAAVRRSDNGGVVLAEEARRRRFVETVPLGDGKDAARAAILASAAPYSAHAERFIVVNGVRCIDRGYHGIKRKTDITLRGARADLLNGGGAKRTATVGETRCAAEDAEATHRLSFSDRPTSGTSTSRTIFDTEFHPN